jgi:hypothetical protein
MEGIEGELQAIRGAQLVVDAKQVVAHGVFTQIQMPGNVAIGQPFGYQVDDVLLSPGKRIRGFHSFGEACGDRATLYEGVQEKAQLLAIRPNLSLADRVDAFAQDFKRLVASQDAASAGMKCLGYCVLIVGIYEHNHVGLGMISADFSRNVETSVYSVFEVSADDRNVDFMGVQASANSRRIHSEVNDSKWVIGAEQSGGHQLTVHPTFVGYEDLNLFLDHTMYQARGGQ